VTSAGRSCLKGYDPVARASLIVNPYTGFPARCLYVCMYVCPRSSATVTNFGVLRGRGIRVPGVRQGTLRVLSISILFLMTIQSGTQLARSMWRRIIWQRRRGISSFFFSFFFPPSPADHHVYYRDSVVPSFAIFPGKQISFRREVT